MFACLALRGVELIARVVLGLRRLSVRLPVQQSNAVSPRIFTLVENLALIIQLHLFLVFFLRTFSIVAELSIGCNEVFVRYWCNVGLCTVIFFM
jgi:hypothetical protein